MSSLHWYLLLAVVEYALTLGINIARLFGYVMEPPTTNKWVISIFMIINILLGFWVYSLWHA